MLALFLTQNSVSWSVGRVSMVSACVRSVNKYLLRFPNVSRTSTLTERLESAASGPHVASGFSRTRQQREYARQVADADRFALAAVTETQTAAKQDKLVFIFNFFDELQRIAPVAKR